MIYSNRIKVEASGGTGNLTLGAAVPSFVAFPDGETTYTILSENDEWEVGIGTVTGAVLVRDTVEENHLGTTGKINFSGELLQVAQVLTGDELNALVAHVDDAEIHMPPGGSTGQVLTKLSVNDYDTIWSTPQEGGDTPTGTNINIDMGTFPEPINANIDAGGFT